MAVLRASLLIFATLLNNTFVIYHRPKVTEAFVCFNKENDSWPEQWLELNATFEDEIPTLRATHGLPKNQSLIDYKLRFIYPDRSFGDTQWKQLLNGSIDNLCTTKTSEGLTIGNSILLATIFFTIIVVLMLLHHTFYKKMIFNFNQI